MGGTVAVFGHDDLRHIGSRAVFFHGIRAVDEHDDIRVLFDRPGLSRRSERTGFLSARCSTARESWAAASTGTFSSRASTFRLREM